MPVYGSVFSNVGASLNSRKKDRQHGTVMIETRTLVSFNFTNVGFLKIDVEGFERTVLNGARDHIARARPTILVEMEEGHTGERFVASLAFMDQFDVWVETYSLTTRTS